LPFHPGRHSSSVRPMTAKGKWLLVTSGLVAPTIALGLALCGCPAPNAPAREQVGAPTAPSMSAPAPSATARVAFPADSGKVAVDVAAALPEVKSYCAALEKAQQPSHCAMWSEDESAPTTPCNRDPTYLDDCLWPVYLGESHPDHAVRFATIWVNLTSRSVGAVSDFACGRMPLAVWRGWRAKVSATPDHPPDCPEEAK